MEDQVQILIDEIRCYVEIKTKLNVMVADYEIMNMFLNKEQETFFVECVDKGIISEFLKIEMEKHGIDNQIAMINPNVEKQEIYAYGKNLANMWYRVRTRTTRYMHPWVAYERYVGGARDKKMAHENFIGIYFYPIRCKT